MKANPTGLIAIAVVALTLGACQKPPQLSLAQRQAIRDCSANLKCALLTLNADERKKPSVDKGTIEGYPGESIDFYWGGAAKNGKVKLKFPNGTPFTSGGKSIKLKHLHQHQFKLKAVTEETSFKYTIKDSKHDNRPELDPVIIIHKPPL